MLTIIFVLSFRLSKVLGHYEHVCKSVHFDLHLSEIMEKFCPVYVTNLERRKPRWHKSKYKILLDLCLWHYRFCC